MSQPSDPLMARNVALYPWFKLVQNLLFWQAVWFLFFQEVLSGQDAILLYALREFSTTVLEVPTGVLSDRLGRRRTLAVSVVAMLAGAVLLGLGSGFWVLALALVLMGAGEALASGTDSALLYQSLVGAGRAHEIEAQQLKAWRFTFTGLAVSAVLGGAMALVDIRLVFWASALVSAGLVPLTLMLHEPPHMDREDLPVAAREITARSQLSSLRVALRHPVLRWLFVLSVLMFGYGHIPFVFGQPFILEALEGLGLGSGAPLVSGAVSSLMMTVSLGTSLMVPWLRRRMGVAGVMLLAFGMQIWLAGMLALSNSVLLIALLMLRMVPSSLAGPLMLSQIQPLLKDDTRATYLSIQSLFGRLIFSAALYLASVGTSDSAALSYGEMQRILLAFVAVGLIGLVGLALTAGRMHRNPANSRQENARDVVTRN